MLSRILYYFIQILDYAILIYCIGSWFVRPGSRLYNAWRTLEYYLSPLFKPAKWILSKLHLDMIPIDFTPWLTMIMLRLIYRLIVNIIVI